MKKVTASLEELSKQKADLFQREEELNARTSPLAIALKEKNRIQIDAVEREIAQVQKQQEDLKRYLEDNESKISKMENDTTAYIEEQTKRMVAELWRYIDSHLEEIGYELERTFHIVSIMRKIDDRYGTYSIYTGDIGIYDENRQCIIISSKDFYFDETLYTTKCGRYDNTIVMSTPWYKKYFEDFSSAIIERIQKDYHHEENFSLTIENLSFTLELV